MTGGAKRATTLRRSPGAARAAQFSRVGSLKRRDIAA